MVIVLLVVKQIVTPIATVLFATFGQIAEAFIGALDELIGKTDGSTNAFKVLSFDSPGYIETHEGGL